MEERVNDTQERLTVLRKLIREGEASTQEELCQSLRQKKFDVTQSTVSRDLRRIGAIKTTNTVGEIVYRLPEDHRVVSANLNHDFSTLILEVVMNENMIVVHTTPGSASLVASAMDTQRKELGILGTLGGDDTIFIAPISIKKMAQTAQKIKSAYL